MNFPATRLAIGLLLLLPFAGCYKTASDETAMAPRPRYTGTEPWTIDGVRPGQAFEEVKLLFGEPREIRGNTSPRTAFWSRHNTVVTFDATGRVTEVMGSTVKAGNQIFVSSGANEAEVVQILGPGQVQESSRPKGSGVISLGRELTGTTLIYDRDGVRFELCVFGEAAGHFLARRRP